MSWWVYVQDRVSRENMPVESHAEGGTYAMGGVSEAELNVTYNYGRHFWEAMPDLIDGFWGLNEMRIADALPHLLQGIEALGVERSDNYWESSKGNAGYALSILKEWCEEGLRHEDKDYVVVVH